MAISVEKCKIFPPPCSYPPTLSSALRRSKRYRYLSCDIKGLLLLLTIVAILNTCERQLRSSDAVTCLVPRTRTCLGDRAFGVAGPRLWNALPISLRQPHLSLGQFRRALKRNYLTVSTEPSDILFLGAEYK